MESQDMAEVVPLFGDRETPAPQAVRAQWSTRHMAPRDKMRLLRILFGTEDDQVDAPAA